MAPIFRILAFILSLLIPSIAYAQADLAGYKLSTGDAITIRVLGEDDLRREKERVSDSGTISFPILGQVRVKGLTVTQVDDLITAGLKGRYLVDPQVTVTLDEYRNFFVNGYVEKPGGYPWVPGLNVRKAITIAGGFKERAAREKLNIVRDDDPAHVSRRVDLNAPVYPGDVLTVEESFF
jgi:polysaccharide export outer membrane protein